MYVKLQTNQICDHFLKIVIVPRCIVVCVFDCRSVSTSVVHCGLMMLKAVYFNYTVHVNARLGTGDENEQYQ